MTEPVWITGIGLVSSLGEGAAPHLAALADPAAKPVLDETGFAPFPVHPLPPLDLDRQIPKKGDQRQMEPWQRLGTYAAGLALDSGAARGLVGDMHLVVAAGGGERDIALDEAVAAELAPLPPAEAARLLNERLANGLRPTLFLAQLSNLLAGNISIVHGVTGSSRTFMGEEQAAADAVRIAAARLAEGRGEIALAGGAYIAGRWDMLLPYAAGGSLWRGAWAPVAQRLAGGTDGGMVMGTAGAFLLLETESHARARGAAGLARLTMVATGAARRRGKDTARASTLALAEQIRPLLRDGYAVLSGATGAAAPGTEEAGFLADLRESGPAQGPLRYSADLIGHTVEAAFPANLALAALALGQDGAPAQVLVTGFGLWRGEALALVERIDGGAT
ncbi:beta-ketoacyl-ACP synthase [Siccirubricoccus sp. G192]|uniref:beta-ketoacyl-ACP synthase n=1 Tax=Siccirubricoccus sp. G192 TaxID=2849651 RepID=UPI001C2C99BD|nr:beta-ketoacyl-ACP synthase [Siccirubricoccus sp. G192]MBV1799086.1 beta-ketoacyl-ACP synthase [Siccirubricoccus sp. G192]